MATVNDWSDELIACGRVEPDAFHEQLQLEGAS